MSPRRRAFLAGSRASLPLLLGILPFGVVTGVALVASGIAPTAAVLMSLLVYAGAAMLAAAQLLGVATPAGIVVLSALFINLRFVMYSASMRPHLGRLPRRWKLLIGYLLTDNPYALAIVRFTEHPGEPAKGAYFLGAAAPVWLTWQLGVLGGVLAGAGLPASWKLEFAAPLAFIAMSVPLLGDRAMVAAALAAAVTVVLAHPLPLHLGVALAALAGIAAGVASERRTA